jgi:DNA-binding beta-propeller fold protein YncE
LGRRWSGASCSKPVRSLDASGGIHVADAQRNTIQVFGPDGRFRRVYGTELGLYRPRGLAAGDDGRFYLADTGRNRVLALTEAGVQEEVIPPNFDTKPPPIDQPTMAIAAGGVVYVAEPTRARLLRLDADGAPVGPPWTLTTTDTLISARLAVGPAGEVVVAEVGARRVLLVCPDADRVLVWKAPDGTAEPRAAVLGPDGTLYVVDAEGRLLATRLSRRC